MQAPKMFEIFFNDTKYLPAVDVNLNDKLYKCLIDTGSSINIISNEILPKDTKIEKCNVNIKTISNKVINVNKSAKVEIKIKNKSSLIEFLVTSDPISTKFDILLGQEFLQDNNCILDFKNNNMIIKDELVPFININEVLNANLTNVNNDKIASVNNINKTYAYLTKKLILPAYTETFTNVKIKNKFDSKLILAESCIKEDQEYYIGRSVNLNKNNIMIKVINPTNKVLHLNKLTKLVEISPLVTENCLENNYHLELNEDKQLEEVDLKWDSKFKTDHLNEENKNKLLEFLDKNKDIFASSVLDLPGCDVIKHQVQLTDNIPVKRRPYRVPYHLREEMESQLNILIEAKILEPSTSAYAAPILLVKKASGEYRLVTDFRGLNSKVVPDSFPIPNIGEAVDNLAAGKVYSSIDLFSGFFQMSVQEEDRHKLAVATPRGLFQFTRTPFGLRTSANSFQRLMSLVLSGLDPLCVGVYIDDIIISSDTIDNHFPKLQQVFDRLRKYKLKLKPSKCTFLEDTVKYLGFVISKGQVFPDKKNIEVINKFKIPQKKSDVQSFLGCINYYRKFIPDISKRSLNLTKLTKDNVKFQWNQLAEDEFNDLKTALISEPCLMLPNMEETFHLYTDASNHSIGAVLAQLDENGFPKPIAFGSRKLKLAETKYSVTEREALAIVYFTGYFRQYLLGKKFCIYTDHAPLTSGLKLKDSFNRIARWTLALSNFDFHVKFLPGKANKISDFMSRQINNLETISDHLFLAEPMEINNENNADFSNQQLIDNQNNDDFCKQIKQAITNKEKSKFANLTFFYQDNILKCKSNKHNGNKIVKTVIPQSMVKNLLEIDHDSKIACHPGIRKTINKICKKYFWPKMTKQIVNWINSCDQCLARKAHQPKQKAPLQRIPLPNSPFEKVSFDIMGPLNVTQNGNRYLVTFIDYFTRYVEAFPIPVADGKHIADVLMQFISSHGLPKKLVSDRGLNLLSQGMKRVYDSFGIKKREVIAYRPQSNGCVERCHRSLANFLCQIINEAHTDWDEQLPFALLALRTSCHDSTKFTPSYLTFGRNLNLPRQFLESPQPFSYADEIDYANNLLKSFHIIYNKVKSNLDSAAQTNEKRRSKTCKDINVNVGDSVYWYDPKIKPGLNKKFHKFNKGPFKVVEIVSPVVVKIAFPNSSKFRLVHIEDIKVIPERLQCLKNVNDSENEQYLPKMDDKIETNKPFTPYQCLQNAIYGNFIPDNSSGGYNLRPRQGGRAVIP